MSDPIRIEANAFDLRWLPCHLRDGLLYGGSLGGPVSKSVPVRVVYDGTEGKYLQAVGMAAELQRAGYERVDVVSEKVGS